MSDLKKPDHSIPLAMERLFISSINSFAEGITAHSRRVAEDTGVPYLIECEGNQGHNYPDCFLDIPKALERLGDRPLIGMYFHIPSLNLVLVTQDEKIGIRSVCLRTGMNKLLTELHIRKAAREKGLAEPTKLD
jgi:hypothetical protein